MTPEPRIEQYARALGAHLVGPRRARSAVVAEIRDGLLEAVDARVQDGMPRVRAVDVAMEELGDPGTLAAAFDAELAGVQSRRVAARLLCSGPLIGSLWATALVLGGTVRDLQAGAWLPGRIGLGLLVAGAVIAAVLAVAATGRLGRRIPIGIAPAAAATAGLLAVAVDLIALALVGVVAATAALPLAWAPVAVAAAASATRCGLAGRAAHHCLGLR